MKAPSPVSSPTQAILTEVPFRIVKGSVVGRKRREQRIVVAAGRSEQARGAIVAPGGDEGR